MGRTEKIPPTPVQGRRPPPFPSLGVLFYDDVRCSWSACPSGPLSRFFCVWQSILPCLDRAVCYIHSLLSLSLSLAAFLSLLPSSTASLSSSYLRAQLRAFVRTRWPKEVLQLYFRPPARAHACTHMHTHTHTHAHARTHAQVRPGGEGLRVWAERRLAAPLTAAVALTAADRAATAGTSLNPRAAQSSVTALLPL
jgi:hypothetical protein